MRVRVLLLICLLTAGIQFWGQLACCRGPEPIRTAWWSLTWQRPNPERLPVKIRFQYLSPPEEMGVEAAAERGNLG